MINQKIPGEQLHRTGAILGEDGQAHNGIWKKRDGDYELHWYSFEAIEPAARQLRDILFQSYPEEKEKLTEIIEAARQLHALYLTWDQGDFGEKGTAAIEHLREQARRLLAVRLPEKVEARDKFIEECLRQGKDSRGRYNPGAAAARLIAGISRLQTSRLGDIGQIKAELAARLVAWEFLQKQNKEILGRVARKIRQLRGDVHYDSLTSPSLGWLRNQQRVIAHCQVELLPEFVRGLPYCEVAREARAELQVAFNYLAKGLHLKAGKALRTTYRGLTECARLAGKFIRQIELETDLNQAEKVISALEAIEGPYASTAQRAAKALKEALRAKTDSRRQERWAKAQERLAW